jgi:ATP-binding cassette subfamily F protein 3
LDVESIDALQRGLKTFSGGLLVVSHDQRFLDSICKEVWVCEDGTIKRFEGQVGNQSGIVAQYKASLNMEE